MGGICFIFICLIKRRQNRSEMIKFIKITIGKNPRMEIKQIKFQFDVFIYLIFLHNLHQFHCVSSEISAGLNYFCVWSEVSAPPVGLAVEQRLLHSLGSRGVCRGSGPRQPPWSAQSITQSHQSSETPLHHLLWCQHPAERVSWDASNVFSYFVFITCWWLGIQIKA